MGFCLGHTIHFDENLPAIKPQQINDVIFHELLSCQISMYNALKSLQPLARLLSLSSLEVYFVFFVADAHSSDALRL
jgi:hypothetical protein